MCGCAHFLKLMQIYMIALYISKTFLTGGYNLWNHLERPNEIFGSLAADEATMNCAGLQA